MSVDGFTVISSCFFALALAVTFALIIQIHLGLPEVTPHGAVATDDKICSEVGVSIMKQGGNSIDAVIASLLCMSVTHPHIIGPGGGGILLFHDHKLNITKVYDFMTAIPRGLRESTDAFIPNGNGGGLMIGVPGFIRGIEHIHYLHGSLSWKKLFEPSVTLARDGFNISRQLSEELNNPAVASFSSDFKNIFFPKGIVPSPGSRIVRKNYAKFLEDVSIGGSDEFYLLKYGVEVIEAVKAIGSNISVLDFRNYEVKERKLLKKTVFNKTILTVGPPFGGLQVITGLTLLDDRNIDATSSLNKLYDAFARGLLAGASAAYKAFTSGLSSVGNITSDTLGRSDFNDSINQEVGSFLPEYHSSQVSAIDTQDLYVTAIAGLGTSFGSGVMTKHEIILNNHLKSSPPHIDIEGEPHQHYDRPFTTYTPLIVLDSHNPCGKRVVLSSGSSSAAFQVLGQLLFRNLDLTPAIIEPRITLGESPDLLLLDDFAIEVKKLPSNVREHLKNENFILRGLFEPLSVNGVSKVGDTLVSHSDTRGGGFAARIDATLDVQNAAVSS